MAVIRRRFLIWLLRAYIKRWGKTILLSFVVGLLFFFLLLRFYPFFLRLIPLQRKEIIGIAGAYTLDSIPSIITKKVSRGLTTVHPDGSIHPDLASSWEVHDNGKTYIFYLKKDIYFSDGTQLTSNTVTYDFSDVKISKPDKHTIVFSLKDAYAPFLVTVSKPLFYKGYIGSGEYKINNAETNGTFIKSLQLVSNKNKFLSEIYIFYPTTEALKIAFALGEVTRAVGLNESKIKDTAMETYPNVKKEKLINYNQLVALFYNTSDPVLSDKRVRSALNYSLPEMFEDGERTHLPYPPSSKFYNADIEPHIQDFPHAKILLDTAMTQASSSGIPKLQIKALGKYKKTAEIVAKNWEQLGVKTEITIVDRLPNEYQIYLGDFNVPKDPDQYTLWHTGEINNITKFRNLRIDKLLEDGRKITDVDERLRIYNDFQKYLVDESPASFLYFPYDYEFVRK